MTDYSLHYAELDRAIRALLGAFEPPVHSGPSRRGARLSRAPRIWTRAGDHRRVVVDDRMPISPEKLRQVDALAASMKMSGDRVIRRLHAYAH